MSRTFRFKRFERMRRWWDNMPYSKKVIQFLYDRNKDLGVGKECLKSQTKSKLRADKRERLLLLKHNPECADDVVFMHKYEADDIWSYD